MIHHTHTHRRADRGTLIVRASVVATGLAASVGSGNPSALCTVDASGSFAFQ
jgi:hypothetical protein